MSDTFIIDGDVLIGRTIPGSGRMRLYHENSRFIAAFDPDTDSLPGDQPKGTWVEVAAGVDPALLKRIEPDVINACRERFAWFQSNVIRCPRCDSTANARILYGLPDFDNEGLIADLESGRYVLGGCVIEGNDPTRHCHGCSYRWVEARDLGDDGDTELP